MKSIGIKDLKNNLSRYLAYVRKGETIIILDRNNPIAEIKKIQKNQNNTELFIKESTQNQTMAPAKSYKKTKLPKTLLTKGKQKEEISFAWKKTFNEDRE